jgi:hypothetical protein
MNLRDGTEELLDPEGIQYESLDALRKIKLLASSWALPPRVRSILTPRSLANDLSLQHT